MSGDLSWMKPMLAMTLPSIRQKVDRLCAVKGVSHLCDEALQAALAVACEKGDYDPSRSSFETYIVNHARWWLGDLFSAKEIEVSVEFVDEYSEEPWTMLVPAVQFVDPFEAVDMPFWYKSLWLSLNEQERECLVYVLLSYASRKKYSYRDLGKTLGTSHVTAGNVLKEIRRKAGEALCWTRALSSLVDDWADAATFRGG